MNTRGLRKVVLSSVVTLLVVAIGVGTAHAGYRNFGSFEVWDSSRTAPSGVSRVAIDWAFSADGRATKIASVSGKSTTVYSAPIPSTNDIYSYADVAGMSFLAQGNYCGGAYPKLRVALKTKEGATYTVFEKSIVGGVEWSGNVPLLNSSLYTLTYTLLNPYVSSTCNRSVIIDYGGSTTWRKHEAAGGTVRDDGFADNRRSVVLTNTTGSTTDMTALDSRNPLTKLRLRVTGTSCDSTRPYALVYIDSRAAVKVPVAASSWQTSPAADALYPEVTIPEVAPGAHKVRIAVGNPNSSTKTGCRSINVDWFSITWA